MSEIKFTYSKESIKKFNEGWAMDGAVGALAGSPESLETMGIKFSDSFLAHGGEFSNAKNFAMDAGITQPVTTGSYGTPAQYLQVILPGAVNILTKVRKSDEIAPPAVIGEYWQSEIVLKTMEHTADPQEWSDHGGLTLASFNETYESRSIVRFGLKTQTTLVGDQVAGATGTNPNAERQASVVMSFEQLRNEIAFYGYAGGIGKTYGILNDPNLPTPIALADGAGGDSTYASKTVAEIISDYTTMFDRLAVQSGGHVDITKDPIKVTIPLGVQSQLYKTDSSFSNGKTVIDWLKENHPGVYHVVAPEFASAIGGENVTYMQAESIADSGTDGGDVAFQATPMRMMGTGSVANSQGGVEEGYLMATAGTWYKRPYAVVRYLGC